jgi:TP901 family phage tail tape measure protein
MANTEKIVVQVVVQGEKDLKRLEKRTGTTTMGFGKMAAGVAAAVTAFRQISSVVAGAIKTFSKFEFEMAKVKAITGATDKDFKRLTATAQKLGRTTFFTASQVAELQVAYGKLGFTTSEILDAQEATLMLATATQSDLGRAAVVAGAAVRGFGLDAQETQRVVDVMAVSFTSSALDIEKFQTSMTKVAPISAAAGISLESTTAVMGTLTDAGIEASIAGTSLRNIFLKMQDPASDLSRKIGFTVESGEDLEKALTKLNEEGLSNADMMELVDLRQVAAFATMVNGTDRIIDLTDAFEDANGAAKDMADIMKDTLQGDILEAKSAWEGLEIAIFTGGSAMTKNIRRAVDIWTKLLTNFADKLKSTSEAAQDVFGDQIKIAKGQKKELDELAEINQDENISISLSKSMEITANELEKQIKQLENTVDPRSSLAKFWDSIAEENIFYDLRTSAGQFQDSLPKTIAASKEALKQLREEQEIQAKKEEEAAKKKETDDFVKAQTKIENQKKLDEKERKEKEKAEEKAERDRIAKEKESYNNKVQQLDTFLTETLNKEKQRLIDGEITQQEYDQIEFDAKQAHLANMLGLNVAYGISIAEINGQILDNELQNIAKRVAAEKAAHDKKIKEEKDEKKERVAKIDEMQEIGNQLIYIAGEEKSLQGVKKAGIAISKAAAIASSMQAIADYGKAIASAAADSPWWMKIINVVGLIAAMASTLSLMRSIGKGGSFAKGGLIEEFANGGMVHGRSHAQGGEKFAVGGRVVELEGGEAVINKRSTSMFRNQLSAMNSAGGGVKFADGGMLNQPQFSQQQFNAIGQNQMMGAMSSGSKVVVVESDITDSQNSVSVIQSDARI